MQFSSMIRVGLAVFGLAGASTGLYAQDDAQGCPNCEATVVLDAGSAQAFAQALLTLNSMPLHGVILDQGVPGGSARVLAAVDRDFAAQNGVDSFDVAKKVLGFTDDGRYGIRSVTAAWVLPVDHDARLASHMPFETERNVGTIGH